MEFNERLNNLFDALGLNEERYGSRPSTDRKGNPTRQTKKATDRTSGGGTDYKSRRAKSGESTEVRANSAGEPSPDQRGVNAQNATGKGSKARARMNAVNAGTEFEMTGEILAEALYNALFDMGALLSEALSPFEREAQMGEKGQGNAARKKRKTDMEKLPADRRAKSLLNKKTKKLTPKQEKRYQAGKDTAAAKSAANARDAARAEPSAPKRTEP